MSLAEDDACSHSRLDLSKPRYDQSTWWGRYRHFLNVTDPRTLFTTKKQIQDALDVLNRYSAGEHIEEEQVWAAQKIKDAIVHPDTGENIPALFRVSAFAPVNMAVAFGLLLPNPGMASILFWQWANQSYNVCLNYANRNASSEMSNVQLMQAYGVAVGVSCSLALGLSEFVKRTRWLAPGIKAIANRFVPFVGVASAGAANCFAMRAIEMRDGIDVLDEHGRSHGKSQSAGRLAVGKTAFSRVAVSAAALTIQPIVMSLLERRGMFARSPRLYQPINFAVINFSLFAGIPASIALFPQVCSVPARRLESRFHTMRDENGAPITKFYYNKGL